MKPGGLENHGLDGYSKLAQKSLQGETTVYDRLTINDAHNQIQKY